MDAFSKITYFLLIFIFMITKVNLASCKEATSTALCKNKEKQALLNLKASLIDPTNRLSSWSSDQKTDDCCKWRGVKCNDTTGHVTELRLGNQLDQQPQPLHGKISVSLLDIEFLSYLDLSGNDFGGSPIPSFIGAFKNLSYLNLSFSSFGGLIPRNLGHISNLRYLDLSTNHLEGEIPSVLDELKHLEHLNISFNGLSGTIPPSLGNLPSLKILCLSGNNFVGTLPTSLGGISSLETLAVDSNGLVGNISNNNFVNNSMLTRLNLSSTYLTFNFTDDWVPPFQLRNLSMGMCNVGPQFPTWLKTQKNLRYLYMQKAGIEGKLPPWFWGWAAQVEYVDLSFNQLCGDLSNVVLNSTFVNLRTNYFEGKLPRLSPHVFWLSVANNSFSETLSSFLCSETNRNNNLKLFHASMNSLSGNLSDCWEHWGSLLFLNLGFNRLQGEIPHSLGSLHSLQMLHLHQNNLLSGHIPASLQNLSSLRYINLDQNQISGSLPRWVGEKWTNLSVLSIRANNLTGNIPSEICKLSSLIVLNLAQNALQGKIPNCLNNLSLMTVAYGAENFELKLTVTTTSGGYLGEFMGYIELPIKRKVNLYNKILKLVRIIDFSSNQLGGPIPNQIFDLRGLIFLNLSANSLTGMIPTTISKLEHLELLDLSRNRISGKIPQRIAMLAALSSLDLSYNNLTGEIPKSTQLQSFNESSYIGNIELCGAPLTFKCKKVGRSDNTSPQTVDDDGGNSEWSLWFFRGMGTGISIAFVGVSGLMLLNIKQWNIKCLP